MFDQAVDALLPELAVLVDPIRDFVKLSWLHLTVPFSAVLAQDNQPTFGKDLDVPGDGRPADWKMLGHTVEGEFLTGQQIQMALRLGSAIAWKTSLLIRRLFVTNRLHITVI